MASHKIAKNGPADEIELSVAQALFDLENNVADLKKELKPLQISSAKEVSFYFSLVFHRPEEPGGDRHYQPTDTGWGERQQEGKKEVAKQGGRNPSLKQTTAYVNEAPEEGPDVNQTLSRRETASTFLHQGSYNRVGKRGKTRSLCGYSYFARVSQFAETTHVFVGVNPSILNLSTGPSGVFINRTMDAEDTETYIYRQHCGPN